MKVEVLNKIKNYEQLVVGSSLLVNWFDGGMCMWQLVHFVSPSHSHLCARRHFGAQGLTEHPVSLCWCMSRLEGFLQTTAVHMLSSSKNPLVFVTYLYLP